jgi:hypothetical protein
MVQTLVLVLLVAVSYSASESEYAQRHAFSRTCLSMHKSGMKHILGARIISFAARKVVATGDMC